MKATVEGVIDAIKPAETFSPKFSKRVVRITEPGKYPNTLGLELINDKMSLADSLQVGMNIRADVNVIGRVHNDKDYTNLKVYQITPLSAAQAAPVAAPAAAPAPAAPLPESTPFG